MKFVNSRQKSQELYAVSGENFARYMKDTGRRRVLEKIAETSPTCNENHNQNCEEITTNSRGKTKDRSQGGQGNHEGEAQQKKIDYYWQFINSNRSQNSLGVQNENFQKSKTKF